jgi:hypothetical protein
MKYPDLCLPYMASDAGLASVPPQRRMTYLSWDGVRTCVLGMTMLREIGPGQATPSGYAMLDAMSDALENIE